MASRCAVRRRSGVIRRHRCREPRPGEDRCELCDEPIADEPRARRRPRASQPDVRLPRLLPAVHRRTEPAERGSVPSRTATGRSRTCACRAAHWDAMQIPVERRLLLRQLRRSARSPRSTRARPARPSRCCRSTRGTTSSPTIPSSATMAPGRRGAARPRRPTAPARPSASSCRSTRATSWSGSCAGCGRDSTEAPRRAPRARRLLRPTRARRRRGGR